MENLKSLLSITAALDQEGCGGVGEAAQEMEVLEVLARLERAVVEELNGIRAARLA